MSLASARESVGQPTAEGASRPRNLSGKMDRADVFTTFWKVELAFGRVPTEGVSGF